MEYMEQAMQQQIEGGMSEAARCYEEINRLQGLLAKHGICEDCGELYNHHGDEPFASCGCNQSEWYELTPHMLQVHGLKAERDTLAARLTGITWQQQPKCNKVS